MRAGRQRVARGGSRHGAALRSSSAEVAEVIVPTSTDMEMIFQDRRDAGRVLAQVLSGLAELSESVALALPRGGVPVAFELARTFQLPLDILVVRKLGTPGRKELAMGALSSGGTMVLNERVIEGLHLSKQAVDAAVQRERLELERQEGAYRSDRPPVEIHGRTVILVDDGLATGASMRAAARAVRSRARRLVIAVPVGSEQACDQLRDEADLLICAVTPKLFTAVGSAYQDFSPTSDEQVRQLLDEARAGWQSRPAA
jgi:putative phosphoribosyl transferase